MLFPLSRHQEPTIPTLKSRLKALRQSSRENIHCIQKRNQRTETFPFISSFATFPLGSLFTCRLGLPAIPFHLITSSFLSTIFNNFEFFSSFSAFSSIYWYTLCTPCVFCRVGLYICVYIQQYQELKSVCRNILLGSVMSSILMFTVVKT